MKIFDLRPEDDCSKIKLLRQLIKLYCIQIICQTVTNTTKIHPQDHKPDCPKEKQRIESIGGSVVIKAGVPRVVWKRQRMDSGLLVNKPPTKESIPFLAVARSLGGLIL